MSNPNSKAKLQERRVLTVLERVRLDIDLIPKELYQLLLKEFRDQLGEEYYYFDWEISAEKEEEELARLSVR